MILYVEQVLKPQLEEEILKHHYEGKRKLAFIGQSKSVNNQTILSQLNISILFSMFLLQDEVGVHFLKKHQVYVSSSTINQGLT